MLDNSNHNQQIREAIQLGLEIKSLEDSKQFLDGGIAVMTETRNKLEVMLADCLIRQAKLEREF